MNINEFQLVLPINTSIMIPDDDSVRLLNKVVEQLDFRHLYDCYASIGRPPTPPKMLFKIVSYAYMNGIYSSIKIEKATGYRLVEILKFLEHQKSVLDVDVFHFKDFTEAIHEKDDYLSISYLEQAKEIYRGEFLEGCYIKNCPELNDWIFYERERLQRKYFEVLYQLIYYYKKVSQYLKAIDILEKMLKMDCFKRNYILKQSKCTWY